jgi:hypothetical protein
MGIVSSKLAATFIGKEKKQGTRKGVWKAFGGDKRLAVSHRALHKPSMLYTYAPHSPDSNTCISPRVMTICIYWPTFYRDF